MSDLGMSMVVSAEVAGLVELALWDSSPIKDISPEINIATLAVALGGIALWLLEDRNAPKPIDRKM